MIVELPIKTKSEANGAQGGWKGKAFRRKRQREQAAMLMLAANRFRPQPPMRIKMIRLGSRAMDSDNLAGSMKGVRDGIADYLGLDDGDPRLTWEYTQRVDGKRDGKRGVLVEIVETAE